MKEHLKTICMTVLYTLGNVLVYHVMFPILSLFWKEEEDEEDIPVYYLDY